MLRLAAAILFAGCAHSQWNALRPDAVVISFVNGTGLLPAFGAPASGALQLAQVFIWGYEPLFFDRQPSRDASFQLPAAAIGAAMPCTLPIAGPVGTGQLSLSGNGRFVSLACYGHPVGPPPAGSSAITAVVALVDATGAADTRTSLQLPAGTVPYSSVTDDGTTAWIGTSAGLYTVPMGAAAGSNAVLVYTGGAVTHVTIFSGNTLWLSVPSAGGVIELACSVPDGADPSTPFVSLPRSPAAIGDSVPSGCTATLVIPSPDSSAVYGHAVLLRPRGPGVADQTIGGEFTMDQATPPAAAFASSGLPLVGVVAHAGSPVYYNFASAVTPADPTLAVTANLAEGRRLTVNSQRDVLSAAMIAPRVAGQQINFTDVWTGYTMKTANVYGSLLAVSANALYNQSLTDVPIYGTAQTPTRLLYKLPDGLRAVQRFGGIAPAPFDVALPPEPPDPSPSADPTPTATISVGASVSPPETATPSSTASSAATWSSGASESRTVTTSRTASATATAVQAVLDPGILMGPNMASAPLANLSALNTEDYLLLLRVGDFNDPRSASAPFTAARPVFVDSVSVQTGRFLASLPLPTAQTGPHRACTLSFACQYAKIRHSSHTPAFATLPCYEARPYVDNITLGRDRVQAAREGRPIAASPPMVAARIFALGNVDTSTLVSSPGNCAYAELTSVVLVPPAAGDAFYVGTQNVKGAPPESEGRCGLRYVPHGNGGADGLSFRDQVLTVDEQDRPKESAFQLVLFSSLASFTPGDDANLLVCFGCSRGSYKGISSKSLDAPKPPAPEKPAFPSLSRMPLTIRGLRVTSFAETGMLLVNGGGSVTTLGFNSKSAARATGGIFGTRYSVDDEDAATGPHPYPLLRYAENRSTLLIESSLLSTLPPDNRTVLDVKSASIDIRVLELVEVDVHWYKLFVLTGEPVDRPWAKAGSAVWSIDMSPGVAPVWTKVVELPCCGAMWTSFDYNRLELSEDQTTRLKPTSSAPPSSSATPSPPPTASPAPFYLNTTIRGTGNKPACTASLSASSSSAGSPAPSSALLDAPLCISPALPAVAMHFDVRGCPGDPSTPATLTCSSSDPSRVLVWPATSSVTCGARNSQLFSPLSAEIFAAAAPLQPESASVSTVVGRLVPDIVAITCQLRQYGGPSVGTKTATMQVQATWLPFEWPAFDDLILFYAAQDLMLSARTGLKLKPAVRGAGSSGQVAGNVSSDAAAVEAALRRFVPTLAAAASQSTRSGFSATISSAVRGTLVSAGAARLWRDAAAAAAAGTPVLGRIGPFSSQARLSISGGIQLQVLWTSADGTLLHFDVPRASCPFNRDRCNDAASPGACGQRDFIVSLPAVGIEASTSGSGSGSSTDAPAHMLNLTCPPACPGLPQAVFPAVTGSWPTGLTTVLQQATEATANVTGPALYMSERDALAAATAGTVPAAAAACLTRSTLGLSFEPACPNFTAPDFEDACTNPNHTAFTNPGCAFGDGIIEPCRACPAHAVCPGGSIAITKFPGYFTMSAASGVVTQCSAPSEDRCTGWDDVNGRTSCGPTYKKGSYGCLACAEGFYPADGGLCKACAPGSGAVKILEQAGRVLGILLAFAITIFALLALLARILGSTLKGGLSRFTELALFIITMGQTLAEVGQASRAAQPPLVQPLYDFMAAFQLSGGITIHQNCLKGVPPFTAESTLLFFVVLASVLLFVLAELQGRGCCEAPPPEKGGEEDTQKGEGKGRKPRQPLAQRIRGCCSKTVRASAARSAVYALCFVLAIAYARACNTVFAMVDCVSTTVPVDLAASMNGISTAQLASADSKGLVVVKQLRTFDSFLCYSGAHALPGGLAWTALVVYLIGFPLWSLLRTLRFVRAYRLQLPSNRRAEVAAGGSSEGFVARDTAADFFARTAYRPPRFFFRHVELLSYVALAALLVYGHTPTSVGACAGKAVLTCLVLLGLTVAMLLLQPHYAEEAWRVPVRVGSFVIAGLVAIMNAILGAKEISTVDRSSPAPSEAGLEAVSIILLIAALVWLLLLIVCVGRSLIQGAKAEARVRELGRQLRAKAAAARAIARNAAAAASRGRGGSSGGGSRPGSFAEGEESPAASDDPGYYGHGEDYKQSAPGRSRAERIVVAGGKGPREPRRASQTAAAGAAAGSTGAGGNSGMQFALGLLSQRGGSEAGQLSEEQLRAFAAGYGGAAGNAAASTDALSSVPLALRRDLAARFASDASPHGLFNAGAGGGGFAVSNPLAAAAAANAAANAAAAAAAAASPHGSRRQSTVRPASASASGRRVVMARLSLLDAAAASGSPPPASQSASSPPFQRASNAGAGGSSLAPSISSKRGSWMPSGSGAASASGSGSHLAVAVEVVDREAKAGPVASPHTAHRPSIATAVAGADVHGASPAGRRVVRLSHAGGAGPASRHRASNASMAFSGSSSRK